MSSRAARATGWLALLALAAHGSAAWAWNPLKSAGNSLGAGAVEAIKPALAATVADVDTRLNKDVDKVGNLADKVLTDANGDVKDRVSQVNNALEARILQIEHGAGNVVLQLNKDVQKTLDHADSILAKNINRIDGVIKGALGQADTMLADRIDQIDETISRSLGNVDVIATKQRFAIEQTLLRVAVLIGLVIFVVIVLVRLWRRYGELVEEIAQGNVPGRRAHIARGLAISFGLQIGAAGVAAGVLFVLYQQLPLGAARQADALVVQYQHALDASLATFDFTRVRFNASQLELLKPDEGSYYQAMAAKGDLIRDVLERPTLLSSASGISSVMDRAKAIRALLGDREDSDLLVIEAVVTWQVGQDRNDEHEAASLCAQALRAEPGGFALAPLARSYVETFLSAPYFDPKRGIGPESEAGEDLAAALAGSAHAGNNPGFPMAASIALDGLMRQLDRASSTAYVGMLEAHADALRSAANSADAQKAVLRRTALAKQVVAAWDSFDSALGDVPGLAGTPTILSIFRLNDAYYSRAKWFLLDDKATTVAPLLMSLPPKDRAALSPPRVGWSKAYGDLAGNARALFDYQEAQRWKVWEAQTLAFDRALVALRSAAPGAPTEALGQTAALAAARLGLYVDRNGTEGRQAYALNLADAFHLTGSDVATIDEVLLRRASVPPLVDASASLPGSAASPSSAGKTGHRSIKNTSTPRHA
jgi:hypothetical protein